MKIRFKLLYDDTRKSNTESSKLVPTAKGDGTELYDTKLCCANCSLFGLLHTSKEYVNQA